jgi:hypothetical protein
MLSRLAAARRQLLLPPRGAPAVAYRSSSSSSAAAAAVHGVAPAPASASVLPDTLDRGSDAYQRNAAAVGGLLSDLRARVSQVLPPLPRSRSTPRSLLCCPGAAGLAMCLLIEGGVCRCCAAEAPRR